jgi:tetraacyldisaccharide-1-P 4'-kinase
MDGRKQSSAAHATLVTGRDCDVECRQRLRQEVWNVHCDQVTMRVSDTQKEREVTASNATWESAVV